MSDIKYMPRAWQTYNVATSSVRGAFELLSSRWSRVLEAYSWSLQQKPKDDDQWFYSPDRALASLTGFMIVYNTMWGYQLHDRPVLDTLIQSSETSSSNYQRLSWRSRETRVRNGRWILPTSTYRDRRVLLHAVNVRHGTDGFTSPPKEGVLRILSPLKSIVVGRVWTREQKPKDITTKTKAVVLSLTVHVPASQPVHLTSILM
jgi:hypothetical protein